MEDRSVFFNPIDAIRTLGSQSLRVGRLVSAPEACGLINPALDAAAPVLIRPHCRARADVFLSRLPGGAASKVE